MVAFISSGFPFISDNVKNQGRGSRTIFFVLNYLIKLLVMFLVMSMSGYVCIAVILGMSMGQIFFEHIFNSKQKVKVPRDEKQSLL